MRDGDLVLQRIRHLVFSLRLALLNLGCLPVGCDTWLHGGVHFAPFPLFPYGVVFRLAPVLEAVSVFLVFLYSGRFFLLGGAGFRCWTFLAVLIHYVFFVLANSSLPSVLRHLGKGWVSFLDRLLAW